MNTPSVRTERSISSSNEIQKLKNRRDVLEKRYNDLKAVRDTVSLGTTDRSIDKGSRFGKLKNGLSKKMRRGQSIEPSVSRGQSSVTSKDSSSSHKILIKAISQLLEKKKDMEEQDRLSYSAYSTRSEYVDVYRGVSMARGRASICEADPYSRRCKSLEPTDRIRMEEDGVPSMVSGRSTNTSINKAIMQLLEKKQSIDMSGRELYRIEKPKAPSLILAGYLRKAVPSRVGEWKNMYVQVHPGFILISDSYGRSKEKIFLSASTFKCRAVKVTDDVMKILSKSGENVQEISFFETKSAGGVSKLWMTHTSVERDAWLAAIQDAIFEEESISELSSEI